MTGPDAEETAADLAAAAGRVTQSKSSFTTAMRLLPAPRRNAMYAIYAFCRDVDDIADEPATDEAKRRGLDQWRREIALIYAGGVPTKPLARALIEPIRRYGLLERDFAAVIDGMQMDAEREIRAPGIEELDLYCARVASAVGKLSVRVFGPLEARSEDVAEHLGRALQLTNILRDLDEDAERGRLYLPREILWKHGIRSDDPAEVLADPALGAVCGEVAQMARARFASAHEAMRQCARRSMRPALMMGGVYRAILERLVRRGWAAPREPVKLSKPLKLWIALRAAFF
ncbi:MAG TPA: presqualene diphosphate synthase HpnD [Stellaceae bacterium]|nr:presqualene diphosphate synthase HpnD [Stellaceae bacterium]